MIRALISAAIVLVLALSFAYIPGLDGLTFYDGFTALDLLGMFLVLLLLALGFAAAFTIMALRIRSQEVLFGLINLVNLPLLFASSALFPIEGMPEWLQVIAKANPVTWSADALRYFAFNLAWHILVGHEPGIAGGFRHWVGGSRGIAGKKGAH